MAGVILRGIVTELRSVERKDKKTGEIEDQQEVYVLTGRKVWKTVGKPTDLAEMEAVELDVTPFSFEGSKEVMFVRREQTE